MSEKRKVRCPAHGDENCADCGRISAEYLIEGPACRSCDYFGETGMHWDSCSGRIRGPITTPGTAPVLDDNQVSTPIQIRPAKSVLTYALDDVDWSVSPRDLVALFEQIGDLVDAGMPGAKVQNITFDRNKITVEIR